MLICNTILGNMLAWSALTPYDFNETLSFVVPFLRRFTIHYLFWVMIESVILRFCTEFIWKRIPPLQPDFTFSYLVFMNCLLSGMATFLGIHSGHYTTILKLQGQSLGTIPNPVYNPRYINSSS